MSKIQVHINDCYIPLLKSEERYLALFGGAGSGKSYFCAQKLLMRVQSERGHRFLVCRKVATTLRESVYKLMQSVISEMGISHEFSINKTDKTFTHIPTGNEILCFGLDDPEKMKSIAGITGVWVEEATELNQEDFDQLDLRLRGETANYKQILLSFNPIDESHWLKKRFEDEPMEGSRLFRTTYRDNGLIDEEYKAVLECKASVSPNYYRIYALGEWGKTEVKSPYFSNFSYDKHVSKKPLTFREDMPIRLSFDFNVNPFVCVMLQIWKDSEGQHVHFIEEITLNDGDIYKMADKIRTVLSPRQLASIIVTGDATSRKREITQRNNLSAWLILKKELGISDKRFHVPKANPSVSQHRIEVNYILQRHPDLKFSPNMKATISDMAYVECDEKGDIIKGDRSEQRRRADHADVIRYSLSTWLSDFK